MSMIYLRLYCLFSIVYCFLFAIPAHAQSPTPPVNNPPVAYDKNFTTTTNHSVIIRLTHNNDKDGPNFNRPLPETIVNQPLHGTISKISTHFWTHIYEYTPNSGYLGTDSLSFKVNDGADDSNVATIVMEVVEPPSSPQNYYLAPDVNLDGSNYVGSKSDSGPGDQSTPLASFDEAWQRLMPGDILYLLDGIYLSSLAPNVRNGYKGAPITIKAKNDGQVIIDGQYERIPISLGHQLNNWWVGQYYIIEGVVAKNSSDTTIINSSHHSTLRRVSAYNADTDKNSHNITLGTHASFNLVEDCIAAGSGRKMAFSYSGHHNTFRRCFTNQQEYLMRIFCGTGEWPWTEHIIDNSQGSHRLNLVDIDSDNDLDFVTGRENNDVSVYINQGGSPVSFEPLQVANFAGHNSVVGDVGNDGDIDIAAAWATDARFHLWENLLNPRQNSSLDDWTYIQPDNSRASRAFGLAMGDLTNDGLGDIASGRYFYKNPGGDMTGSWTRTTFPVNADASIIIDVDNDQYGDVIAQAFPAVYWFEATDTQGSNWTSTEIGTIPQTGHGNTEGYALADLKPGGKPEIIFGGGSSDIYYFEIPSNPDLGDWPRTQITDSANLSVGIGDVDRDGDYDVVTGSRPSDVAWLENPADGSSLWTKHIIGTLENWVDHAEVADFNGDGKPDIAVAQEGSGTVNNYWYEAPVDPKSSNWQRHLLVTQNTTNSLDSADMDWDGDVDVIMGEHRGTKKVTIWENLSNGSFVEHVIDSGKESHDGAQVYDLDNDGDFDIVSIAWDDYQFVHLWRNDTSNVVPSPTINPIDLNGDGVVDIIDYYLLIEQFPHKSIFDFNRLTQNL